LEENINIEELFRSNLQHMEATPPAGAFEAIQAKLALSQTSAAATTATAAKSTLGLVKIISIATIAVGTGLGVGYIAFKEEKPEKSEIRNQKSETVETTVNTNPSVTLPDNVEVTEISSVNKRDKVVSIVEIKKGSETQKVLVEYTPQSQLTSHSIVGQWLSNDRNKYSQELINKLMQQLESGDETVTEPTNNSNIVSSEMKVQKLEESDVIAGISASVWSGQAPLTIDFSNLTSAESYEWNFGDNTTTNESSPRHTFTEPGNFIVILQVKNRNGKSFTDKVLIEVKDKTEEIASGEESQIYEINIFTPNADGKNDVFRLKGKNIESFEMTVTDQKGKVWFRSTDLLATWDGSNAPDGNYICTYTAIGKDKKEHKSKYILKLAR